MASQAQMAASRVVSYAPAPTTTRQLSERFGLMEAEKYCPPCGKRFTNVDPRVKTCSRPCGRHEQKARAQERRDRIVELSRQGLAPATIADMLSVTQRTVERARAATGLSQPAQRYGTEDEKLQAKLLLVDGASYEEVGRTLSRHSCTVAKWHPGYKFTKQQTSTAAAMSRKFRVLEGTKSFDLTRVLDMEQA